VRDREVGQDDVVARRTTACDRRATRPVLPLRHLPDPADEALRRHRVRNQVHPQRAGAAAMRVAELADDAGTDERGPAVLAAKLERPDPFVLVRVLFDGTHGYSRTNGTEGRRLKRKKRVAGYRGPRSVVSAVLAASTVTFPSSAMRAATNSTSAPF